MKFVNTYIHLALIDFIKIFCLRLSIINKKKTKKTLTFMPFIVLMRERVKALEVIRAEEFGYFQGRLWRIID